jgi:hypothetical protein
MPRKVSPHLMHQPDPQALKPLLEEWQPTVIKSLGIAEYLAQIADLVPPTTALVQRYWWDDPFFGNPNEFEKGLRNEPPDTVYEYWKSKIFLPPLAGRSNVYVESFNETGTSLEYLRFEAVRTRRLWQEFGLRSCVINMASGTSDGGVWGRAREAGLLDALRETGSVIGIHSYAGLLINLGHGDAFPDPQRPKSLLHYVTNRKVEAPNMINSFHAFRVTRDYLDISQMGYGDLKFIITEFGLDNIGFPLYKVYTGNREIGSWKSTIPYWQRLGLLNQTSPERFYAQELAWAEQQLQAYPFVLGATVFTVGSQPGSLWEPFDVYPAVTNELMQLWKQGDSPMASGAANTTVTITVNFTSGRKLTWNTSLPDPNVLLQNLERGRALMFVDTQGVRHMIPVSAIEFVTIRGR